MKKENYAKSWLKVPKDEFHMELVL